MSLLSLQPAPTKARALLPPLASKVKREMRGWIVPPRQTEQQSGGALERFWSSVIASA